VHSECLTGDVFHSLRCDCGQQLHAALDQISRAPAGVLLYLRGQEGRGIGLTHKLKAYELQEQGLDTVEANEKLGFPADQREYGIGAQILHDIGVRKMRLMTNNPRKFNALRGYDLEIIELVSLQMKPGRHNHAYLETKRTRLGHTLDPVEFDQSEPGTDSDGAQEPAR
jgi:3,4-dihydroxy 2-butanone 4-phosphate synthase / GTP cyclohydrolase II